jgi:hypothetical protein
LWAIVIYMFILYIKNENTYRNQIIIMYAIRDYLYEQIKNNNDDYQVSFDDIESYHKTLWRLTDWSYKKILPRRKYRIIEPYIRSYKEIKNEV